MLLKNDSNFSKQKSYMFSEIENIQDRLGRTEGHLFVPVLHESLTVKGESKALQRQTVCVIPLCSQKKRQYSRQKSIGYSGKCVQEINKGVCT